MTRQQAIDHTEGPQSRAARRAAARVERARTSERRLPQSLRLALFAVIVVVIGAGAIGLIVSRLQGPATTDVGALQVHGSMSGLSPKVLTVKAGQPAKIELASMDTAAHSDGGGWHGFAIDSLGINWKVGPLSSKVFEFTAPTIPGKYTYYCGICCGGKENPTMVGTLEVTA